MGFSSALFMVGIKYKGRYLVVKNKIYKQKRAAEKEAKKIKEESSRDDLRVIAFTPSGFDKAE